MKNYLNLTSGLEWAKEVENYSLVRIQSSHFEATKMWSAVMHCDYQFLIDAATCGVNLYDCGSRSGEMTRAQWMGIPWFKYAYWRANKFTSSPPDISRFQHFSQFYEYGEQNFSDKAKQKLRYIFKLTSGEALNIVPIGKKSLLDGKTEELAKLGGFR